MALGISEQESARQVSPQGGIRDLRVMSYNIRAGLGATSPWENLHHNRLGLEPLAAVIAAEAPDLVALQEVVVLDVGNRTIDETGYLAQQLGMHYAFGLVRDFPVIQHGKHVGYGLWGNAVLSRFPIVASRTRILSNIEGFEPRSVLETRIDCAGSLLTFLSTHLSFRPVETVRQSREVAAYTREACADGQEVILAGDFNAPAGSVPMATIQAAFQDSFTLWGAPIADPCRHSYPYGRRRIKDLDHVFLSPHLSVRRTWVCEDETGASDHNPVVAEVRLN